MPVTAVIISNGNINDYGFLKKYLDKADFVICADGGARHLKKLGVMPDVLLGDFDSIDRNDLEYYRKSNVKILEYPVAKDKTDTELAVEYAAGLGVHRVIIIGALGCRFDHSLCNTFALRKMLDLGIEGVIADEHNEIRLIRDRIYLDREEGVSVSLLPLTEKAEGVTVKGMLYPLDNAVIQMGSSWGVSNEFRDEKAEISVKKGLLLVIKSRD